ncbi:MAG: antitoxin [Clostridia bacterium]|nr:antitoxin [Clostridia bacterium]
MSERFLVVAARIRQELEDLEQVVARAERAMAAARRHPKDQDLYVDSAALNLHDFYGGLERIFYHIATAVDGSPPTGREWHRDLLKQMSIPLGETRPRVLSSNAVRGLDEYLRFRHVVRNIYAFELDPVRIERLAKNLRPVFEQVYLPLIVSSCPSDIADSLAKDDIKYLASRHVIYGATENCDLAATGEDLTTLSLSESGRIRDGPTNSCLLS